MVKVLMNAQRQQIVINKEYITNMRAKEAKKVVKKMKAAVRGYKN